MSEQELTILNDILNELREIKVILSSLNRAGESASDARGGGMKAALLQITSTLPPPMQKMMEPLLSQLSQLK